MGRLQYMVGVHSSIYGKALGKQNRRKTHLERAVHLDGVEQGNEQQTGDEASDAVADSLQ